jgi:heavy metal sensor kinase
MPIRVRMTAWHIAVLALIVAALGAFLVLRLHSDLLAATDTRLKSAVDQIAIGYHNEGASEARDVSATVLSGKATASQVMDRSGRVNASYGGGVAATPMLDAGDIRGALAGARVYRTKNLGPSHRLFRVVGRATTRGDRTFVVVAGEATAAVDRSVSRLRTLLVIGWPVAILIAAASGWWLATRALRPISRMTDEADGMAVDRLSDRLPVPATGDEVARLAETLNRMLGRVEAGVQEQHRLVGDASHELRSPLAAIRAEIEVSLRGDELGSEARAVLLSTLEEVERLSAIVDGLLILASADQGALDLHLAPVDLARVTGETVARLRALAATHEVEFVLSLEPAAARGDARWLAQAAGNLLDNAVKFGPSGGTVIVTTAVRRHECLLRVLDEGPGIPAEDRERIFDRFYRRDRARTRGLGGTGIGLSIVREIALAHRGRVWVEEAPGGGSAFTLAIPAAGRAATAGEPAAKPAGAEPGVPAAQGSG